MINFFSMLSHRLYMPVAGVLFLLAAGLPALAQPTLVKDIHAGAASGLDDYPTPIAVLGNQLLFAGTDGSNGASFQLWKSDGTPDGTVLVKNINTSPLNGILDFYITYKDNLYFLGRDDASTGIELWRTDGTEAGTQLLKDICSGGCNSLASFMGQINGKQFFVASDFTNGGELWITDGTPAGTQLVKDIFPGFLGSNIFPDYAVVQNRMIFNANDNVNGDELWITDGTPAGTTLLADVRPGAAGSSPRSLRLVGNTLFFTASQPDTGRELWRYDIVPPTAVINASTDTSCVASPIQFTAAPVPNAIEYRWLFGQGASPTIATGAGPHDVSFNSPGLKNVRLIVRNLFGADTVFQPIQILPLPAANFTYAADGNTVTFTNTSNNAASYQWTFGDGATSTEPNPVHTYPGAGSYPVKLRAENLCGFSEITLTVVISVGLEEPHATAAWRLAPNPTEADFSLRLHGASGGEALQLELFDALGRQVHRAETVWLADGQTVEFRNLGLTPGLYRLSVLHAGGRLAEYAVVVR